MKSMTGYGRAERQYGSLSCLVEILSVNRKSLDIKTNLPENLIRLEIPLRKLLSSRISRGMITLRIFLKSSESEENTSRLNLSELEKCYYDLQRLKKKLSIKEEPSISDLLLCSTAIEQTLAPEDKEFEQFLLKLVSEAVDKLDEMKISEGSELKKDISYRLEKLSDILAEIEKRSEDSSIKRRETLFSRIKQMGLELNYDDERLMKELAIFAEKCDITEEIIRLKSHIEHFKKIMEAEEIAGKNLDFISQEFQREINTISAKIPSANITEEIILFKSETEKIREQVQNIE